MIPLRCGGRGGDPRVNDNRWVWILLIVAVAAAFGVTVVLLVAQVSLNPQ